MNGGLQQSARVMRHVIADLDGRLVHNAFLRNLSHRDLATYAQLHEHPTLLELVMAERLIDLADAPDELEALEEAAADDLRKLEAEHEEAMCEQEQELRERIVDLEVDLSDARAEVDTLFHEKRLLEDELATLRAAQFDGKDLA